MPPVGVAAGLAFGRRCGLRRIAGEPGAHVEPVELLAPDQPRVGLALHLVHFGVHVAPDQGAVEVVGLLGAIGQHRRVGTAERLAGRIGAAQPQPHLGAPVRLELEHAVERHLAAGTRRVHRRAVAADDVLVEGVLGERTRVAAAEQLVRVGVVLGGEDAAADAVGIVELERHRRQIGAGRDEAPFAVGSDHAPRPVALAVAPPRPGVAEPQLRQHVQPRRERRAVAHRQDDAEVLGVGLGVADLDVEVAVELEHAGVDEFELALAAIALPVLAEQPRVRKLRLRVLVERAQPGRGRQRVEVEVLLLDVLAVVALGTGESEQALLQERITFVPQRPREAESALAIGDAEQAVFAPAVGAPARVLVREVVPAVAVLAVVLAHRAPLPLGEVGPPALPVEFAAAVLAQAFAFGTGTGGHRGGGVPGDRVARISPWPRPAAEPPAPARARRTEPRWQDAGT